MTPPNLAWQQVTCRSCGKAYVCTPYTDYYNATNAHDGLCWQCLWAEAGKAVDPEPPLSGTVKTRPLPEP